MTRHNLTQPLKSFFCFFCFYLLLVHWNFFKIDSWHSFLPCNERDAKYSVYPVSNKFRAYFDFLYGNLINASIGCLHQFWLRLWCWFRPISTLLSNFSNCMMTVCSEVWLYCLSQRQNHKGPKLNIKSTSSKSKFPFLTKKKEKPN